MASEANAPSGAPLLSFRSNFYRSLPKKAVARPDNASQKNEISKGSLVIDHAKKQTKVAPTKTTAGIMKRGAESPAKDRKVDKPYDGLDYTTTFLRGQKADKTTKEGKYERGAVSPVKDRPPAAKPYDGKDFTTSFYKNQARVSGETGDDFLKKLAAVEKVETDRQAAEARKPSNVKAQNPGASYSASAVKPSPAPAPAPASSFFSMMTGSAPAPAPSPAPAATKPAAKASGGVAAKVASGTKAAPAAADSAKAFVASAAAFGAKAAADATAFGAKAAADATAFGTKAAADATTFGAKAADAAAALDVKAQIGQLCPCLASVLKPKPNEADVAMDMAAALIQGQASTFIDAAPLEGDGPAAAHPEYGPIVAPHMAQIEALFRRLDKDSDGALIKSELKGVVAQYNGGSFDEAQFFGWYDVHGRDSQGGPDGQVDLNEFAWYLADVALSFGSGDAAKAAMATVIAKFTELAGAAPAAPSKPAAEPTAAAASPEDTSLDAAAIVIQNSAKEFVSDSGL